MKSKRIIAALMSLVMLLSLSVPVVVLADDNSPTITVKSVAATPGETVDVDVTIANNPGILGATLEFEFDEGLTLVNATSGDAFSALTMTRPGRYTSPCKFTWDGQDISSSDIKDGTILTLKFEIDDEAGFGSDFHINASYDSGDFVNMNLDPIDVVIESGVINVVDAMPGDLNGDTKINTTDVIMMRRHIAGGYDQSVNEYAADVNDDSKVNNTDVILLRRYLAGGYEVTLKPSKTRHIHEMDAFAYKAPTCTDNGNIAYWRCRLCENYYSDENGNSKISLSDTVLKATGHTVVVDPAIEPTYGNTGLTEGKHCSVCNEVIVSQQTIPKLTKDEYSITYYISNNDDYLKSLDVENPNPAMYSKEDGLELQDLIVDGYYFLGWFTAQTGGTQVTEIPVGTTGNKRLYAHWEKVIYTISYECDMVPIQEQTYTVGVEKTLPKPKLDKYTFVGWSDKNGKMWDSVPAGTTGNLTLYANWSSDRNKAVAVNKLADPLIIEDSENGLMLFTYEIGEVKNVPLFTTLRLNCVNGIISTVSKTNTNTISETQAKGITQTISNATTNSSSWTLSEDWNKTTEISQTYLEETKQTREEAETTAKNESNTYNLTKSNGGTNGKVTLDGTTYNKSENEAHSKTNTTTKGNSAELSLDVKGKSAFVDIEAKGTYEQHKDKTKTGTTSDYTTEDSGGQNSTTETDMKTWNNTSGYSNSSSTSQSNTVSNSISKLISSEYGYGSSYSDGGSNSESQTLASTDSKSDEYSTTMTYYTSKIDSTTTEFSSTGQTTGDYRMVMAGTVHVFAVVGYDVATKTYFVYTYNVLDDNTEEYLDYSYDGTFDDYETSIIPFEVPYFINQYVNGRIGRTEGLVIDADTGAIVDYMPDADNPADFIVIPTYVAVNNNDGTNKSIKVGSIDPILFKHNTNIVGVKLGNHITDIPDCAFEDCTSLKYVIAPGATKIGNNAFKNCTSLKEFAIPAEITQIGINAFENAPSIKVTASNADVAQAAAMSGANNTTLDISAVPATESKNMAFNIGEIESFELQGKDKEYKGLSVKSDAAKTVINGVTFTQNSKIPMELSSADVTLDRVAVDSSGYALVLKSNNTNLILNQTINLTSNNGNTMLCKNINLGNLSNSVLGKLNVTGNVLVCGSITNDKYLTVNGGQIKYITAEEFENYLSSHKVTFDANGGTVSTENKMVAMNTAYGELPNPSRDYYTFDGWYTEADGGDKVTADTIMTSLTDITLYAHWIQNDVSAWTLAENVPSDAQIVDRKYKYTLTSYTTSSSSSLSGWTKYDTQWRWSDYGGWSDWSNGSVGGSDSRQVETRTIYRYHYYQCYDCLDHHPYCVNRCDTCGNVGTVLSSSYGERWEPVYPYNTEYGNWGGNHMWTYFGDHWWANLYFWDSSNIVSATQWRYRDRSKIYTYYYKKDESKESTSYPSGSNISNIQEYVQYRVK